MFFKWLPGIVFKSNRRILYEQLQWQRFLLRTGVPSTIIVLDMVVEDDDLLGYTQLRLWAQVKISGVVQYRHMQTLMSKKQLPSVGDSLHIRFCPDDLSKILIV